MKYGDIKTNVPEAVKPVGQYADIVLKKRSIPEVNLRKAVAPVVEQFLKSDIVTRIVSESNQELKSELETVLSKVVAVSAQVAQQKPTDLSGIEAKIEDVVTKQVSSADNLSKLAAEQQTTLIKALQQVYDQVSKATPALTDKTDAMDYVNVRLTDGKSFYKAIDQMMSAVSESYTGPSGLVTAPYNSISATYPDEVTEVYTYSRGNQTVATVTVVYSDSTKATLISVTKS